MSKWWGDVLALVVCLGLCMPLQAARAEGELKQYIDQAVKLYEELDYELALEELGRARKVFRSADDAAVIALYEGIILADLGRGKESRAAFRSVLLRSTGVQLPLKVSPKLRREFETLRTQVLAELALRNPEKSGRSTVEELPAEPPPALAAAPPPEAPAASKPTPPGGEARPAPTSPVAERPASSPTPPVADAPTASRTALAPPVAEAAVPPLTPVAEVRQRRAPVVPWVLLGVGAAAGGAGTWFGLASRGHAEDARGARFQDELLERHAQAKREAKTANILFGTAGLAAAGAVVTWLLSPSSGPAVEPKAELSAQGGVR